MTKKELEELKDSYLSVFDEDGNVRACGRALCLRLMLSLKKFRPKVNLGNFDTGVMNVDVVKNMYKSIVH
jgi:hypothetical protein